MAGPAAFAPYRLPAGALPEEGVRAALEAGAEPLLASLDDPLPAPLLAQAFASIPAGHAAAPDEACRGADGSPAGVPGAPRACYHSERHRARLEAAIRRAYEAGYAGVCLELPDAPLALGILGAGFCADCQRAFARELAREYGDHFQPLDFLALAREALASSSGALGHQQLPFGREFWRVRSAWLDRAMVAWVRAARDAARAGPRPFQVAARFEAVGPAQLRAARLLDAAVFPVTAGVQATGAGLFRLLRAVMGRRPCAAELRGEGPLARLAGVAASSGVEVALAEPSASLPALRRFARAAAARDRGPALAEPLAEVAVLYSPESDLWTGGEHRAQVERAGDALAGLQVQAPVVLRVAEARPGVALVLAGASALSPLEVQEVRRRLDAGGGVLCLGEPGAVDEAGRPAPLPFPAGKPAGVKATGGGLVVRLPPLPAPRPGALPDPHGLEELARTLQALLGRGRRAASSAGRSPLHVALYRQKDRLDAHVVSLADGPVLGATLFVGLQVAGDFRRGRFKSSSGADERIPMNPSGYAISTVLPTFEGYGILSLPG
ncbi:MAG: hypothetical protein HZB56_11465 [Deltaproteobacteria bacterium]|nr:hypothetical protein [Deltaproteobacteria bacterium]